MKNAAMAAQKLSGNPFMISLKESNSAKKDVEKVKKWWIQNIDAYKIEKTISDQEFEMMNKLLFGLDYFQYGRYTEEEDD